MRWKPDTCDCVLEFFGPQNTVAAYDSAASRPCAIHAVLPDPISAVMAECQVKNNVLGEIVRTTPALTRPELDADGQIVDVLDASKVSWAFDGSRDLVVSATDAISRAEKSALRAALGVFVASYQPDSSGRKPAVVVADRTAAVKSRSVA